MDITISRVSQAPLPRVILSRNFAAEGSFPTLVSFSQGLYIARKNIPLIEPFFKSTIHVFVYS